MKHSVGRLFVFYRHFKEKVAQFFSFVRKEFIHVFRDHKTLLMLFGMPIVQIILFGFALTNEIKYADIAIVDNAKDMASQEIIQRIEGSQFFNVSTMLTTPTQAEAAFRGGKIKLVLVFPANFNNNLLHFNKAPIQILADASDPNTATTLVTYMTAIVGDYQREILQNIALPYAIVPEVKMLYNPDL